MRRTTIAVGVLLAVGMTGGRVAADPMQDGVECAANGPYEGIVAGGGNPENETDRFFICVYDGKPGNGPELYAGGELFPEYTAGPCGAIIVAGQTLFGDPAWHSSGSCD